MEKQDGHHEHIKQYHDDINKVARICLVEWPKGDHGPIAGPGVKDEDKQDHQVAQVIEKDQAVLGCTCFQFHSW